MRRLPLAALVLLFATGPAYAKKVDNVAKWLAEGKCAEAVTRIDEWEAKNALGSEDYELRRQRVEAALCVAKGADTVAGWEAFLARFSDWPEAAAARSRVWDLAFTAAQVEGTAAGMLAYVKRYPDSPHVQQALKQEEAWAFEDASKSGNPKEIEKFLAAHPDTKLREQAWEAVVQSNSGIYLITAGGEPRKLEPVVVTGDQLVLPTGLPATEAYPLVGVNLPGAGRGETSEWWALRAIRFDAEGRAVLSPMAPLAEQLGARLGVAPPGPEAGLLTMIRSPGSHLARVATSQSPLALSQGCPGFARFAFVLSTPGYDTQAFPFAVDCPETDGAASPIGLLMGMLDAAEAGDRVLARQRWGAFVAMSDAAELRAWLASAVGPDPYATLVANRPAPDDWIVWTTQPSGQQLAHWIRADDGDVRVLATRPGWAVAANGAIRTTLGDPACERLDGSLGSTLFCASAPAPTLVAFDGQPLGWGLPSPEALVAAALPDTLGLESVLSVGPRWQEGRLQGAWKIRSGQTLQSLVAEAPAAWVGTAGVTPALASWLNTNAGSGPLGLSRVEGDAAALYAAFTTR